MEVEISYEQHVQQNNERLKSIKEQLVDIRGYEKGCRELISWCADPRAFHAPFEENLLGALGEVVNVASRDGFDYDLAFSLISCCHLHRKLLSRAGSIKINRWYEQMKRHKRAQNGGSNVRRKNRSGDSPKKLNAQLFTEALPASMQVGTMPTEVMFDANRENALCENGKNNAVLMWSGPSGGSMVGASLGGTLAAPQMSPAFGPMSSEYGMAPLAVRNQAESMQMQQMNQSSMRYQQYMQGQMPSPSFVSPNGMQQTYPIDPAGARPGSYMGPQCVPTSSYVANSGYGQAMFEGGSYSRSYPQQVLMASGSNMQMSYRCQQGYAQSMRSYNQQQQQQLLQMQQTVPGISQQQVLDPAMYSPAIPTATQRTPGMSLQMMASSQVRGMMMTGGYNAGPMPSSGEYMRARAPGPISPAYPNGAVSYSQSQGQSMIIRAGQPMLYSQMQSDLTRQQVVAYPNPNANANFRDPLDPMIRSSSSYLFPETRMAICEEVIQQTIAIRHETNTVEYMFKISEEKLSKLRRGEIDVQLKSNAVNFKQISKHNVWPEAQNPSRENGVSSVSVFINSVKVEIKDLGRSLYLGNFCQEATNKLVITSSKCVCSHSFTLQYIRWKPVQQVISEILSQRKQDVAAAKQKALKIMLMDMSQSRVSLCWLGKQRIRVPARSINCKHTACFDLEPFLSHNLDCDIFVCPYCKICFSINDFEVDHYFAQILFEAAKHPNVSEVNVDVTSGCFEMVDPTLSAPQQQRASTPYSKNPGSVPQCSSEILSSRQLKRPVDGEATNSSGNGPSLKRIKSESFAPNGNNVVQKQEMLAQSPFNPGSVPAPSTSWISSPNGAVLPSPNGAVPAVSPCGPSISPPAAQNGQQQQYSSTAINKYSGPDTPVTPGSGNNPASVGPSVSPGGTQMQNVMNSQGSVEAVSVAGSAPYTPASVSSLNSGNHCGIPASSVASGNDTSLSSGVGNTSISDITCSLNASALDDVLEELIFTDAKTSCASDMEVYLRNEEILSAETKGVTKEEGPSRSIDDDQDWLDFAQVIAKES